MAQRVYLHLGAPKSGSTYVQSLLWANRSALAEAGLLVPGRALFDHNMASIAIREGNRNPRLARRAVRTWERLVSDIRRWDGDVIVSNEWLCWADASQARTAVETLAPAQVNLVFTARPLAHQIPAAWQEILKIGLAQPVEEFVDKLDHSGARWSWSTLDPAESLVRWAQCVTPDRVHLVTLPPRGSDRTLLWQRVCGLLEVDADTYDTSTAKSNESLGVESAVLLQRLGPALRAAIMTEATWADQYRWIREYLAHRLLVPLGGDPIAIGEATTDRLRARARHSVDVLDRHGFHIIGSLEDLLADDVPAGARDPNSVSDSELLAVAMPLVAELLGEVRRQTRKAEAQEQTAANGADAGEPE
jgi:hypothetical protein